ncbi:MAG: hypothetical protein AAGA92_15540 [Planctomycetota bacterium]
MFVPLATRNLFAAALLATAFSAPRDAAASDPVVHFDFAPTAACADVGSEQFLADHPGKKLIEIAVEVSVSVEAGDASKVEEIRVQLSDAGRRLRVESFSPQTTLESEYTDDIQVTTTTESNKAIGASLGGEAPVVLGDLVAHVTPTINGSFSKAEAETQTAFRKAPRTALVVAGTVDSAHGVFFKLRPSPQTTLEGVHELVVRFVVPENWRADELSLQCSATGEDKVLWMKQQATWAERHGSIAVYLAGDAEARDAAEQFARRVARR